MEKATTRAVLINAARCILLLTTLLKCSYPAPEAFSPFGLSLAGMSPSLWSGAAAVPGVLQLGRAQLWFGCILYFYCWTLTMMSLISHEWTCSLGLIVNASCPQCPSWQYERGKDEHQIGLLVAATVLGAFGYICLALRWLPMFSRFPALKLLSVLLLVAVIVLDFEAHYSYRSSYDGSVASSANSDTLFFCTGVLVCRDSGGVRLSHCGAAGVARMGGVVSEAEDEGEKGTTSPPPRTAAAAAIG